MEDGARTLRKQKAAYDGTQEWVFYTPSGVAPQVKVRTCPGNHLIAGLFFYKRFGVILYVLFFIELALSAKEVST